MKRITSNTILRQGDKEYKPVVFDGVICWEDQDWGNPIDMEVVAQSKHKFDGIPVVDIYEELPVYMEQSEVDLIQSLGHIEYSDDDATFKIPQTFTLRNGKWYMNRVFEHVGEYTRDDLERAISLAREVDREEQWEKEVSEIIESLNSLTAIEVDEHFNIIGYE
jgi:hypothetical protein